MNSASPRSCTLEGGMHPSMTQTRALPVCEIQIDADAAITGKV